MLRRLLLDDAPRKGEAWAAERAASVDSAASAAASTALVREVVRALWPQALSD